MDYFTVSGQVDVVALDVDMIARSANDIGLVLYPSKCKIICSNEEIAYKPFFKDYIRVRPEDMTLLGATVLRGAALTERSPSKSMTLP